MFFGDIDTLGENAKPRPMIVDLKKIGFEGEHHHFDEKSEELHGVLTDLVGSYPFVVDLEIFPLGNTYQVRGYFHFTYDEDCSRCGYDITLPTKNKINELLVKEKERPRKVQSVHEQKTEDLDSSIPSVTYLTSDDFNLGEFLHEMVAFAMSSYPACEDVALCESRMFKVDEAPEDEEAPVKGHPGFAALKKLKLN